MQLSCIGLKSECLVRKKVRQVDSFEKFGVKGKNREMGLYMG